MVQRDALPSRRSGGGRRVRVRLHLEEGVGAARVEPCCGAEAHEGAGGVAELEAAEAEVVVGLGGHGARVEARRLLVGRSHSPPHFALFLGARQRPRRGRQRQGVGLALGFGQRLGRAPGPEPHPQKGR